jgi:methyltransferase
VVKKNGGNKMKILLVVSPQSNQSFDASKIFLMEPLAMEYLAAGVQANHDVKLLDLRVDTETGFRETLESFQPDILGCGAFTVEVNTVKNLFAEAKKVLPGILTVVGGIHASVVPSDFFEDYVDVVVMGEGVEPFRKICDYQEIKKSFEDIENIYSRKNGKMVFSRKEPLPHLDTLPLPARELTAHLRHRYVTVFSDEAIPWISIRGSAGCTFRCNFCSASMIRDYKVYRRSIDKIVEELESRDEPFAAWVDDELFIDPEWAVLLANEIDNAGIKKNYSCFARADTITKHPNVIEAWAKVGLRSVYIGMESHRMADLKKMKKGTNISKNANAADICHENNVKVRAGFIVQPDYDKKDFKNLARYVRQSGVDFPTFSVYTPLPGTALYEELKSELITDNYNLFDMVHPVLPTKLPLKQFAKEFFRLSLTSKSFKDKMSLMLQMNSEVRNKIIRMYFHERKRFKRLHKDYTASPH